MSSNAFRPSNYYPSFRPLVERTLKVKGLDQSEAEALMKRFEIEAIESVEDIDFFGDELLDDEDFLINTLGGLDKIKSLPHLEKIRRSRSIWKLMLKKARFTTFVSQDGTRKTIPNARIHWGGNIEWEKPDNFNGDHDSPPPGEMHIMRSYEFDIFGKWKIE